MRDAIRAIPGLLLRGRVLGALLITVVVCAGLALSGVPTLVILGVAVVFAVVTALAWTPGTDGL